MGYFSWPIIVFSDEEEIVFIFMELFITLEKSTLWCDLIFYSYLACIESDSFNFVIKLCFS